MPWFDFIWTDENEGHIFEHGITASEVEFVIQNPSQMIRSRSSNRTSVIGFTQQRRELFVVYEEVDEITIYPITAYERSE